MNWKKHKLGNLIEEFSLRAKDYKGDIKSLDFLGVSNIHGITKSKYAAEDKASTYKIIEKDCLAYNPYRINVGSIGLVSEEITGLISPAYVVFKTKRKSIIPELLLKFLKSVEGLRQIKLYARGTVRQALRYKDLSKIEISLPNYKYQKDLFERFCGAELKSNMLSKEFELQLSIVKKLRMAFLKEAMQGKLVAQNTNDAPAKALLKKIKKEKEQLIREKLIRKTKVSPPVNLKETPFKIPDTWIWCRLGNITEFITKGTTPKQFIKIPGIPYLKVYNIVNQRISFEYKPQFVDNFIHENLLKRSKVYPGDVIMNIVGPPLGKVAIIPDTYPEWNINQAIAIFRPIKRDLNKYIYWYLCFGIGIANLRVLGIAGQDNLSLEQCRNIVFPLPPLNEQRRVVKKIENLMNFCDELENNILDNQKKNHDLLTQELSNAFGIKTKKGSKEPMELDNVSKNVSKFDSKTILMDLVKLLKKHDKLYAEDLWKMSKFPEDIDEFYAELKKQIETNKTIKESTEKGYLELV